MNEEYHPYIFQKDYQCAIEKITYDYGALRCIMSKMEFGDLLNARFVCPIWKDEAEFFIRHRNKTIDLATNRRLKEYLRLDPTLFPSINLDLGALSDHNLAKCYLTGVKELFIHAIVAKWKGKFLRPDSKWLENLKEKFLKLLQQPHKLTTLKLQLTFPINCTMEECEFVRNLTSIQCLTFFQERVWLNFGQEGIGTVLVSGCPSLKYLKIELEDPRHPRLLKKLLEVLNQRKNNGFSIPILSIQPKIYVTPENFEAFKELTDLGLRFEVLSLTMECENRHQFNEVMKGAEALLRSTAGLLKKLFFELFYEKCLRPSDKFNIPFLPKVEKLMIGVDTAGDPLEFISLPKYFPCLKELTLLSDWISIAFSGKVLNHLDKLVINCKDFRYIPKVPPIFPVLREIEFTAKEITQEFLRFIFTNLTSVEKMKIHLPFYDELIDGYFDAWEIFTGGALPPPHVVPPLNITDNERNAGIVEEVNNSHDEDLDAVFDEVSTENLQPKSFVASFENFTNLREVLLQNSTLRDIQAIAYMTQLKKMPKLDRLVIYPDDRTIIFLPQFIKCMYILGKYHCLIEIK